MRYINIRGLDQSVSVVGLGCIGGLPSGSDESIECLDTSNRKKLLLDGFDNGVNLFDLGEDYEGGFSEVLFSSILRLIRREQVIVSTKFKPSNNRFSDVVSSCNSSLSRLDTDYIDIYQMQWKNPVVPLEETIEALLSLRDAGKVRAIGLSNLSLSELSQVLSNFSTELSTFQLELNIPVKDIAIPIAKVCQQFGITPVGYRSIGFLKECSYDVAQAKPIVEAYNSSIAGLCLAWSRQLSEGISLVQTMNLMHLREAISSVDIELSVCDLATLEAIFAVETSEIPVLEITVVNSDRDRTHPIYTTLDEAVANPLGLSPSPVDIALEIEQFGLLRPVEVIRVSSNCYKLVQGRMRFWGWMIAKGLDSKIPCKVFARETLN